MLEHGIIFLGDQGVMLVLNLIADQYIVGKIMLISLQSVSCSYRRAQGPSHTIDCFYCRACFLFEYTYDLRSSKSKGSLKDQNIEVQIGVTCNIQKKLAA